MSGSKSKAAKRVVRVEGYGCIIWTYLSMKVAWQEKVELLDESERKSRANQISQKVLSHDQSDRVKWHVLAWVLREKIQKQPRRISAQPPSHLLPVRTPSASSRALVTRASTLMPWSRVYLRTQPFPKKKAVGQAPHLPRGLTQRFWLAWRQNLWSENYFHSSIPQSYEYPSIIN